MKLETLVILTKGACLTIIPTFTALGAGLGELGLTSLFGLPIKFWSLMFAALVAGAGGMLAFLSTSFSQYLTTRTGPAVPDSAAPAPKQ